MIWVKDILFSVILIFAIFGPAMAQDSLRIAFGSCNKENLDQSYWINVEKQDPSVWVWLGDIVYANNDPGSLKGHYKSLYKNNFYKTFRKSRDVYGIWDDHDYGAGDGGKSFLHKAESRDLLFDFLDVPKRSAARDREGAYQSYRIEDGSISVRLILLDVRYFREELKLDSTGAARYIADSTAVMLGDEQWKWLETELNQSSEDVILIGSGSQIIPVDHTYEKWSDYPGERSRLFDLLKSHDSKRIVLLSGDRHFAEVSAIALSSELFLYEITSSGLTHCYSDVGNEYNGYRIRELHPVKNFGMLKIIKNGQQLGINAVLYDTTGKELDSYEIYRE